MSQAVLPRLSLVVVVLSKHVQGEGNMSNCAVVSASFFNDRREGRRRGRSRQDGSRRPRLALVGYTARVSHEEPLC